MICTCMRAASRALWSRSSGSSSFSGVARSRLIHSSVRSGAGARVIPEKRDAITTPSEFLTKIGRSMSQHESKLGSTWEELWSKRSEEFVKAGITAPKDRKYILRQMEYYIQGRRIRAIKAKAPKKFRGRGPRVQKGVRVR